MSTVVFSFPPKISTGICDFTEPQIEIKIMINSFFIILLNKSRWSQAPPA
jgi:hypothetical protein